MKVEKHTRIVSFLVFLLSAFGVIMRYSFNKNPGILVDHNIGEMIVMTMIGMGIMFLCSLINVKKIKKSVWISFGISMILLLLLLTPFGYEIRGVVRWVEIGPLMFRPAELVIITYSLVLAFVFEKYKEQAGTTKFLYSIWAVALIFAVFVSNVADDGNHLVVIFGIAFFMTMMFTQQAKSHLLALGIGAIGIVMGIIMAISAESDSYRIVRLKSWLNPYAYRYDTGYVAVERLEALKRGGLFGVGFGKSTFVETVPGAYDNLLVQICEELGWIAGFLVVIAVGILLYQIFQIYKIVKKSENCFAETVVAGIMIHLTINTVTFIGRNLNLLPAGAWNLPFVTYAGLTGLLTYCEMGLVLAVTKSYNRVMKRKKVEE